MNPVTLHKNILASICPDQAIKDWCQTTYSSDHAVLEGVNLEDLPPAESYPLIALFPVEKEGGRGAEDEELIIGLAVAVYDEAINQQPDFANLKQCLGITRREELRQLAIEAFVRADLDDGYVKSIVTEYSPVETWPFFLAVMEIEITRPYQRGENRLI